MTDTNLTTVECNNCGTNFDVVEAMLDPSKPTWCSTDCRKEGTDE